VDNWCAGFEKLCQSRGIRVTAQRLAVYKALAEDLAHATAESVYARLSKRLPGLSFATIYRTLQFFENEKLIRKVSSPGAIGRCNANVDPHQHLARRVGSTYSQTVLVAIWTFDQENDLILRIVFLHYRCKLAICTVVYPKLGI